jgi:HK97 family phage prohead protease
MGYNDHKERFFDADGGERRFLAPGQTGIRLEERQEEGSSPVPVIVGYAAVFHDGTPETEFALWPDLVERIMPGAFDRALTEDDPAALRNHDVNILLGRKSAGTLDLSVDDTGLLYQVTPPDTEAGRETIASVRRGDLNGSSFGFVPRKVVWTENEEGPDFRDIHDVELWDVGPVVFPAFSGTTTGVRSAGPTMEAIRQEYEDWKRRRLLPGIEARAAAIQRSARSRTLS